MEADFHGDHVCSGKSSLESVYLRIPTLDHLRSGQLLDPGDEHILVVRAIEDGDVAWPRQFLLEPPEEMVPQFGCTWCHERTNVHTLRIHRRHQVADRSVLAAGVQSLQNNEDRLFLLREEALLKVHQLGTVFLTGGRYLLAVDSLVIAGVNVREAHLAVPGASLEHVPHGSLCHWSFQFSRAAALAAGAPVGNPY